MVMYTGAANAGTQDFTLQEFEPSFGSKLHASVREAWLESYGPVAKDWADATFGDDEPKLTGAEVAAKLKESGLKTKISTEDGRYSATQIDALIARQTELAAVRDVRDRTPWDLGSPIRGAAMFGAGIVDPINLATAFVPWTRMLPAAAALRGAAVTGETFLARTGARSAVGAADAGISTLALEVPYSLARNDIGDDYGALDSVANIAFGTAFGAGIHAGGGAAGDLMRYLRTGRSSPAPAIPVAADGTPTITGTEAGPITAAPNPEFRPPAGIVAGGPTQIRIGNIYEPARWSVVDADQLSATVNKADNQFRDRSRAAYQTEIHQRANNLDFNLLSESPVMDYGAPTLTADGRIVGGNGRSLFISRAYDIGRGGEYRAALESRMSDLGLDPSATQGMAKPVLVRVLENDVDVRQTAMLSNEGGSTDMSPLEQAKVDAERLGDTTLDVSVDGDLNAATNRNAIRSWVEAQPENKRNSLVDDDGRLSATGLQRLNAALMFKAFGDSPVLGRLIEAIDPGSRNIARALGQVSPAIANARTMIAAGDLHPVDISPDINLAVEKYNQLREQRVRIADYMAQTDAFGDGLTVEARLLLDFMGRNVSSPRRMADAITGFYDRLSDFGSPKQTDMFGSAPTPDKMNMLQSAIDEAESLPASASDTVAALQPETREAATRASVAQMLDGREVDVDAIVNMDESIGTSSVDDMTAAADRNFQPENKTATDFESSEMFQEMNDATTHGYETLEDAQAALDESTVLLDDLIAAGDEAYKYSRGFSGTDEATGLPLNSDGTVTVYHHTNAEAAAAIRESGSLRADAEPDVYVTTRRETDTGYGDTAVAIRVKPELLQLDDEFPDGRMDFRMSVGRPGGQVRVGIETRPAYSVGEGQATPADILTESVRRSFGDATDSMVEAGQITVVNTPADIPGGPHPGDVKAATAPDGRVYIVAQNVSEAEARGIVLHEVGVHVGMENMVGPEVFGDILNQIDDAILRGESWATAARNAVPADTPAGLVREEQLAYLVENAPEQPLVKRIIGAIRAWAYRTFNAARKRMTLTEADYQAMAVAALKEQGRARRMAEMSPAFSRNVAQTDTKQFRDWFGDSAVRDAEGNPMVMYHGTLSDFTEFNTRSGIYFVSPDSDFAARFTTEEGGATAAGAQIMPVYVSAKRPFDYQNKKDVDAVAMRAGLSSGAIKEIRQGKWSRIEDRTVIESIKQSGFDGVYVNEDGVKNLAVFSPEQIKSATGNTGSFDPNNPDIRYSRGPVQDPSTIKNELQPYDDAISRAQQYSKVLRAAADKLQSDAQATDAMRAAMPDISAAEINDLLTQLRQRTKGLAGMARTARNSLLSPDVANSLQSDAMKAADELGNNLQMAAVIEKRNAQLNIAARLRIATSMTQYLDSKLDFEGFMAELVGTERRMEGGRLSVDAEQKNFRGQLVGGFIADLEKSGQFQTFVSGKFDRDIYAATWDLSTPGADMSRYTPEVRAVAEVLQKYNTAARNLQNRFGAWIGELPGYVTSQSHDMIKIRHAGVDEFKKTILPLLDLDRTLGENPGDIDSFLTGLYDSLASGVHLKSLSDPAEALAFRGQGAALARKVSQDRVIHFKDGSAAFEYNKKFGAGTLAESVVNGLEKSARTAGLLKKGGTNPRANYERAFDEYAQRLIGADPKRRNKFQTQRKVLNNVMDVLDGTINIPGNAQAAQVFGGIRALQSMSKLGGMLISSITDLASYGAELRFSQGRNLASGTLEGAAAVIRGRSNGEQKAVLNSLGVFHESIIGQTLNRFDNPDLRAGVMSKMMQQFFKLTGQNRWTESLRDAYVLSHSNFLASNAGTSFDKLPAGLGDMLSLYNIDAAKWEVLRTGPLTLADGRNYLTPESVASIPRAALENYITGIGRTVSDTAVQNLRDDLSSSLRAMAIDRATHAVVEPNARARAFMTRGTQPGTLAGEIFRLVGQFKSFPVAMTQMILGREIYGRGYNTLGEYVRNGRGDMLGMVTLMATYTALGYAAMSIKDLLKGKNPRPMDDPRTWMAAFIQGGGAGIYGDFLFGKFDRMGGSITATLAGPTFGNLDAAADLWTRIRDGDDSAAAAFRFALNNTPFINLFYTRTAMDYLFLYQIQEAMNPGFLRRMERRAERENAQTYYLPPSQVTR